MKKSLNNSLSLRKVLLAAMVAAPLATVPAPLWALPSTGSSNLTSSAGSSTTITTVGSTLSINTPDRTVLKWVNFGSGTDTIGSSDAIIYNLPSSSSSVLNMVTGGSATLIDGTLSSNGRILILNQNGITLSATGNVSAAGLSLSTRPETEFYYAANGDLGYTGTPTNDITVNGNVSVGSSGTVVIAGKNVNIGTAPTAAEKIDAGTVNVSASNSGAVTIGGAQVVTFGNVSSKYGTLSVNTNGGTLNIAPGVGDVVTGANATLTTGAGAVTQAGAGNIIIGTGGTLTVSQSTTSTNGVSLPHLSTTGNNTLTVNLTSGTTASTVNVANTGSATSANLALTATTGDGLTATTAAGSITLNASNIGGALTATATGGDIKSGGNVTVKSGSNISLTGTNITFAGVGDLTTTSGAVLATVAPAAGGNVTISSDGSIQLPAIASSLNLTVTSGGQITEAATVKSTGTATLSAGDAITLSGANDFATLVIKNAPNGTTVTDANGVTLGKGTSATGDVALTATTGTIALGGGSSDTLSFGGALSLTTTNANVTQASNNTSVTGTLTVTAGSGNVILAGNSGTGNGLNNTYGKINVVSGANVSLFAKNTLNLGDITASGTLTAYSATGISNSGKLDIAMAAMVGAGTAAAPGPIALDHVKSDGTSNNLQGTVTLIDDINLLNGTASAIVSPIGNPLASSVSIVNTHDLTFSLPTNLYSTSANIPVSLKVTGANNILSGALNTSGTVALVSDTGSITENNGSNAFSTVSVTSNTGAVTVSSGNALTVNATLPGNSTTAHPTAAVSFTSSGNITLGSITSLYDTGGTTFAGKSVVDSVPGIFIYGPVTFTASNGNVNVSQSGHNFGGITANSSGNNGNVIVAEGGTMKIDSVTPGNGTISLSSANGDIKTGSGSVSQAAAGGAISLSASNGKITLTGAANALVGAVGITAWGNTTLSNTGALALGTVTVSNGFLKLTAAGNVTQSGAANIFGDTTVTQTAAGKNISLTNTGNQFGGLILSTAGGGNISITESGTMNLKSVQTSGKLTATSVNSDIIDSADSNVTNNGISNGAAAIGAASFVANNGNIILDNAANWFSSVAFTTNGNATIVQPSAGGSLTLGTSTVGGALTVTTQGAGAGILEASNNTLTIIGNVTLNTNAGAVTLDQSANQFGPVRFVVGQASTLTENTTFNLNAGTVATAPVIINTNGNFVTSGTGGSSFTSDLTVNAIGTIIPSAGSLLVTGTFTVFSNNTKDLSALSKSGNLAGHDPVNLGSGTYVAPSP